MARRLVNPHFLPDTSAIVSRKEIYTDDDGALDADSTLIDQLHDLIRQSLVSGEQVRKRRKIQVESPKEEEEELIPFRLVSSSQPPHPILLEPKPPPPPITREPEVEDNEEQAALRMERAQESAIDASQIFRDSQILISPPPNSARKLRMVKAATLPTLPPTIAVVECVKPPRSTRPPVNASHLRHHPYNNGPVLPTNLPVRRMECPTVPVISTLSTTRTKHKRRKGKASRKERPPPTFWRPNPAVGGKSLGYAMGFPCSLEALQTGSDILTGFSRRDLLEVRLTIDAGRIISYQGMNRYIYFIIICNHGSIDLDSVLKSPPLSLPHISFVRGVVSLDQQPNQSQILLSDGDKNG
ncbi:hypothetical protein D9615_004253 [Tricholomella constricta]|uniref:Uncharacterized protein n=1 Tax=Tricholomella constricta TaxID=117010 RepID=A0A8H5HF96_9AGAR|nr:hypothetical protein D9615_004253 [Tricholomella constricta]